MDIKRINDQDVLVTYDGGEYEILEVALLENDIAQKEKQLSVVQAELDRLRSIKDLLDAGGLKDLRTDMK